MSLLAESARQSDAALVVATHDRRVLNAVETVVEMKALP
jgi:ABC-type lipoprotein export system ATPase subunit